MVRGMMTKKEYEATKDYLRSVVWLNKDINDNIRRIGELKAKVRGVSIQYSTDKVQSFGSKDKIGDIIAEYTALEQETDEMIDEYVDLKNKIRDEIEMLDRDYYKSVLKTMYLDNNTVYETAVILEKPDGTVKRWHNEAIINFFEKHTHKILYTA